MVFRNGLAAMIRGEQAKVAFSPSATVRSVGVSVTVGGGGGGGRERERERYSYPFMCLLFIFIPLSIVSTTL